MEERSCKWKKEKSKQAPIEVSRAHSCVPPHVPHHSMPLSLHTTSQPLPKPLLHPIITKSTHHHIPKIQHCHQYTTGTTHHLKLRPASHTCPGGSFAQPRDTGGSQDSSVRPTKHIPRAGVVLARLVVRGWLEVPLPLPGEKAPDISEVPAKEGGAAVIVWSSSCYPEDDREPTWGPKTCRDQRTRRNSVTRFEESY